MSKSERALLKCEWSAHTHTQSIEMITICLAQFLFVLFLVIDFFRLAKDVNDLEHFLAIMLKLELDREENNEITKNQNQNKYFGLIKEQDI